jgi:ABC-2 type transport system ATP-binding protein
MLHAKDLTKKFSDQTALDALNLDVKRGDVFCLLGANGAGKTTTINLFLNFIAPSSGSASVNGIDVTQQPLESKKHLAYIPETVMLYGNLTGIENLSYFSTLSGFSYSDAELLGFLVEAGLEKTAAEKRVSNYSKGMRQKVGIALALAKKASALLLDEPTSGLDPKASNEFSELLKKLSSPKGTSQGAAILMATHDLFRAKESGTHIGIMKHGKLLATMNTADISHTDLEKLYLDYMRD